MLITPLCKVYHKPGRGRNDIELQLLILLLGRCVDGKELEKNKIAYLTGNRISMKDIFCMLDYIRGTAAIKLKVDINTLDYYDAYKT